MIKDASIKYTDICLKMCVLNKHISSSGLGLNLDLGRWSPPCPTPGLGLNLDLGRRSLPRPPPGLGLNLDLGRRSPPRPTLGLGLSPDLGGVSASPDLGLELTTSQGVHHYPTPS
jgi:hypothetical protein